MYWSSRWSLYELVEEAGRTHRRVEVTKDGRRVAVLMGADGYDSLMETLDVLGDAETMAQPRQADADVAAGRVSTLEEVEAEMRAKGRLPG